MTEAGNIDFTVDFVGPEFAVSYSPALTGAEENTWSTTTLEQELIVTITEFEAPYVGEFFGTFTIAEVPATQGEPYQREELVIKGIGRVEPFVLDTDVINF